VQDCPSCNASKAAVPAPIAAPINPFERENIELLNSASIWRNRAIKAETELAGLDRIEPIAAPSTKTLDVERAENWLRDNPESLQRVQSLPTARSLAELLHDYSLTVAAPSVNEEMREALKEAWGALNFILAFYDPGANKYLDTEAWKRAEASGRHVRNKLADLLAKADQAPQEK
jgi:hypothetical protein